MAREQAAHELTHEHDTPFVFISGALALDLVNTEVVIRRKRRDLLVAPSDLAGWWRAARRHHPSGRPEGEWPARCDEALLLATKTLRSALRSIFSAVVERRAIAECDLDALNGILQLGRLALETGPGGALIAAYRTPGDAPERVLLPIALSALHLLTQGDRSRLHKCRNERCILLFYDMTRSATRHWCSVECMNRARSSQNYRRRKGDIGAIVADRGAPG
jgi:predicted RNA-binding Zn ribbon-like protein